MLASFGRERVSLRHISRVRRRAPGRRGPAVRVLSRAVCAVGPRRSPRCGHPARLARVAALALRLRARIAAQRPKRRRVRVRAVPCPPMRRATAVDSTPAAGSTGRPLLAWVTRPCAGTTGLLAPSHGPPPASRAAPLCLHSALSLPCTSVCSRPRGTARLALAGRSVGSCPSTPPAATNADRLRSPATAVTPPQPRSVPPLQCAVPVPLCRAPHTHERATAQRAQPAVRCSRGSPAHVPAPPGCSLRRTGHRRPLEPPLWTPGGRFWHKKSSFLPPATHTTMPFAAFWAPYELLHTRGESSAWPGIKLR